jgi:hypothetical protein
MDQYKASIDSVDNALARLNQTLQSYSLFASKTKSNSDAKTPNAETQPPVASEPHESNPVSESSGQNYPDPSEDVHARSEIRKQILGLRSSIKYPEVCREPGKYLAASLSNRVLIIC